MDTVGLFQTCLTATVAGENFEQLATAEATIKSLRAQNQALLDHIDDTENRSRRSNLRIVNILEGRKNSKDLVKLISELLVAGPELERAHRVSCPKTERRKNSKTICSVFSSFPGERSRWSRNRGEVSGDSSEILPRL